VRDGRQQTSTAARGAGIEQTITINLSDDILEQR
jgi:hypothetical protein